MVSVEERYLESLIPDLRGRTVLDVGCGSGRWLERLSHHGARKLIGIDNSPEMLARAAARQCGAELLLADCEALPLEDGVADVALSSFVIGYLSSLELFAAELRRLVLPGGTILISDLHPATATHNEWQRSFSIRGQRFVVDARFWPLQAVISAFQAEGFHLISCLEPCFGEPEFELIAAAGKSVAVRALASSPAIAILAFEAGRGLVASGVTGACLPGTASESRGTAMAGPGAGSPPLRLRGGRVARSGSEAVSRDLKTDGTFIAENWREVAGSMELDLKGYLLLPGLVNAHDHLEFALFPRLGSRQYQNFREWSEEIYLPSESPVHDHLRIPTPARLWWGGLRNLLAGVTTVCHHNPFLPEVFNNDFPVDVVRNFGWAHSLALDSAVRARFASTPGEHPFVIHLGEGIDEASAEELNRLDALCGIDSHTVLVHGVGLTAEGRALLRRRGAALVWCPTSNMFLFGTTLTPDQLAQAGRFALGTDSPLTAAGDMLDEIRFAAQRGMSANGVYELATRGAADVMRLSEGEGTLACGGIGNIVALRDRDLSPADTLIASSLRDVGLVVRRGRVQLVSDELMPGVPAEITAGLHPLMIEDHVCWVRAPLGRLFHDAVEELGCDLRLGGKEIRNVSAEFF
jgi:cytosine/adenosine deaminase-related metal-dependent hydrolase/SAM-dependent methyltransferase